jgi:hypothetical protein
MRKRKLLFRPAWERGLTAHGGELQDAAAALRAKVREGCAHYLDRADGAICAYGARKPSPTSVVCPLS